MKGFENLGKPVTYERFENGRANLIDMYPEWPADKVQEVLKVAVRLIEQDNPDALWGHVNAPAPLDAIDWVGRMRLGAALLANVPPITLTA